MQKQRTKEKLIFAKWMAEELKAKGNNLLFVRKNIKHEHYMVYAFEETIDLLTDMHNIKKRGQ
ncbi:hypothetical protein ACNHOZ_12725 [Priestia sp. D51]